MRSGDNSKLNTYQYVCVVCGHQYSMLFVVSISLIRSRNGWVCTCLRPCFIFSSLLDPCPYPPVPTNCIQFNYRITTIASWILKSSEGFGFRYKFAVVINVHNFRFWSFILNQTVKNENCVFLIKTIFII